jgi:hypothetical protein
MLYRFPGRVWKSKLSAYAGAVAAGTIDEAVPGIPLPGPILTAFSYGTGTLALSVGVPMSLSPTVEPAGAVRKFGIFPGVPAGLIFNDTTGVLSGTPTTPAGATLYTFTGEAAYTYSTTRTITVT